MSTNPLPLTQPTSPKPSLKAPLILLALMFIAASVGIRWVRSAVPGRQPHLPPNEDRLAATSFALRVSRKASSLARWNGLGTHLGPDRAEPLGWIQVAILPGHRPRYQDRSYRDGTFALDGEQVWSPGEQGVLHWDGQSWHSYSEVTPSQGASIVAGDGQVWIVDHADQFFHFEKGKWATLKLALPGMRSVPSPEAGSPELARTADGTVWLVWQRLWRLYGDIWLPGIADGKLLDHVTLIGAAGNRLWLSDESGVRSVSVDGSGKSYTEAQTGIPDEVTVDDVASDGKLTWFATSKGLYEFYGSNWRRVPRPNESVPGIHALAAAPDGSLWAIGATPGGLLKNTRYLIYFAFLIPVGILGAFAWLFQRIRRRQLQQHQRVTQAVQHATGEVPVELEIGQRQLASSGWVWAIYIFGSTAGYYLLRKVWPQAPYWMIPVLAIAIHLVITFQQSLVKRKPQAWDPIGPGAPSQYDWGKTLKSVGGALFFLLVLNANRFPALRFLRGYTFWAGLAVVIGYKSLGLRMMNQALRRGDYDGALKIIRWMHFYNPSGSEAMRMSGHILLAAGRYREAEDALRRSFSSSSAGPDLRHSSGISRRHAHGAGPL